jgi:hypothetical protein
LCDLNLTNKATDKARQVSKNPNHINNNNNNNNNNKSFYSPQHFSYKTQNFYKNNF